MFILSPAFLGCVALQSVLFFFMKKLAWHARNVTLDKIFKDQLSKSQPYNIEFIKILEASGFPVQAAPIFHQSVFQAKPWVYVNLFNGLCHEFLEHFDH